MTDEILKSVHYSASDLIDVYFPSSCKLACKNETAFTFQNLTVRKRLKNLYINNMYLYILLLQAFSICLWAYQLQIPLYFCFSLLSKTLGPCHKISSKPVFLWVTFYYFLSVRRHSTLLRGHTATCANHYPPNLEENQKLQLIRAVSISRGILLTFYSISMLL